MLGALPADDRRHALQQLVGDHQQRDAAMRRQPFVPAANERISRPRTLAHRHRSSHLRDVDDDTRPDRVRTPNDLPDVYQRTRCALKHTAVVTFRTPSTSAVVRSCSGLSSTHLMTVPNRSCAASHGYVTLGKSVATSSTSPPALPARNAS